MIIKGKTDNLDIIEIKSYFVKDRFKWMKRQATDWEKIFEKDHYPKYTKNSSNSK